MQEAEAPLAQGTACVLVIGMHRSGTSAVSGLLARMGLRAPRASDLIPATRSNQGGHWESKSLVEFNEQLLANLGGSWAAPPELPQRWGSDDGLDPWRSRATDIFKESFGSRPMSWKDPRLCILLPFWKTVIEPPMAAIFVQRDPLEVAMSLGARDGLVQTHGLALWERYTRAAASGLDGIPTLSTDYRRTLEDPGAFSRTVADFLREVGVDTPSVIAAAAAESLDSSMHRQHARESDDDVLVRSARHLAGEIAKLEGPHTHWERPDLGQEPRWVGDVLSMRAQLDSARRAQKVFESSRAHRLVTWIHKLQRPLR